MLTKIPKIGQIVEALSTNHREIDGVRFQTKGNLYEIVGISEHSNKTYFIGDSGNHIYIDEWGFFLYRLHKN